MRTNNRRPMHGNKQQQGNRYRRGGGQGGGQGGGGGSRGGRPGGNARFGQEEHSNVVSPQQRRHASNQQNKFLDLAQNARQNGERVEAEYYMQHVEHYTRILNLADEQFRQREEQRGGGQRRDAEDVSDNQSASDEEQQEASQPRRDRGHGQEQEQGDQDSDESRPRRPGRPRRTPISQRSNSADEGSGDGEEADNPYTSSRRRGNTAAQSRRDPEQQEGGHRNSGASLQGVLPVARDNEN